MNLQLSSPLFRLPPELRQAIYEYGTHGTLHLSNPSRVGPITYSNSPGYLDTSACLMQTCKRLYAETQDIYLATTVFIFTSTEQAMRELKQIPERTRKKLKGVWLNTDPVATKPLRSLLKRPSYMQSHAFGVGWERLNEQREAFIKGLAENGIEFDHPVVTVFTPCCYQRHGLLFPLDKVTVDSDPAPFNRGEKIVEKNMVWLSFFAERRLPSNTRDNFAQVDFEYGTKDERFAVTEWRNGKVCKGPETALRRIHESWHPDLRSSSQPE